MILFLIGFNVETVEYKNISFTVWDVGGQVSDRNGYLFDNLSCFGYRYFISL